MTVKRYEAEVDPQDGPCSIWMEESVEGHYVTYSDYQKLVAENAALKAFRPQPNGAAMMEALDSFFANEEYPEGAMSDAFEILCCKRVSTPATDAAIAEIKAQGIDKWIESRSGRWNGTTKEAEEFAANLRAGSKG